MREHRVVYEHGGERGVLFLSAASRAEAANLFRGWFPFARVVTVRALP